MNFLNRADQLRGVVRRKELSAVALELRSLISGIDFDEHCIIRLLEQSAGEVDLLRATFQNRYAIDLEELLVVAVTGFGPQRLRLLELLYPQPLAGLTNQLYLGLSGKFSPALLATFLRDAIAGGFDDARQVFRTPEQLAAVARIYERWYGCCLHPDNPSLTYAVWYELENYALLPEAMAVLTACLSAPVRREQVSMSEQ